MSFLACCIANSERNDVLNSGEIQSEELNEKDLKVSFEKTWE